MRACARSWRPGCFWKGFLPAKMSNFEVINGVILFVVSCLVGSFLGIDFRSVFATPVLWNLVASGVARKRRIWLSTYKKRWIFKIFQCSRGRRARSKAGNRVPKTTLTHLRQNKKHIRTFSVFVRFETYEHRPPKGGPK